MNNKRKMKKKKKKKMESEIPSDLLLSCTMTGSGLRFNLETSSH
jgi:hypothetical protein